MGAKRKNRNGEGTWKTCNASWWRIVPFFLQVTEMHLKNRYCLALFFLIWVDVHSSLLTLKKTTTWKWQEGFEISHRCLSNFIVSFKDPCSRVLWEISYSYFANRSKGANQYNGWVLAPPLKTSLGPALLFVLGFFGGSKFGGKEPMWCLERAGKQ